MRVPCSDDTATCYNFILIGSRCRDFGRKKILFQNSVKNCVPDVLQKICNNVLCHLTETYFESLI